MPDKYLKNKSQGEVSDKTGQLETRILDVVEDLFVPGGTWAVSLNRLGTETFFQGPQWLGAWTRVYGSDRLLWLLSIERDGEQVGILPLWNGRNRILKIPVRQVVWLGAGERVCPEHLDAILEDGFLPESAGEPVACHFERTKDNWDVIQLPDSSPDRFAAHLGRSMKDRGYSVRRTFCSACPRINLPASYEKLLASYSYNQRRTARRIQKRIDRSGRFQLKWLDRNQGITSDAIERALSDMTRLHTLARNVHDEAGNFGDNRYREFHRLLMQKTAEHGSLRLAFLHDCEKPDPIAFRYGFRQGRYWIDYQTGYDPSYQNQRVGWYVLAACVQRSIEEGATIFDMLRGNHEYKDHWATDTVNTETVWVFNNNVKGRLLRSAFGLRDMIRKSQQNRA